MNDTETETEPTPPEFEDLAKDLQARCAAADLSLERETDFEGKPHLILRIPNGRQHRDIVLTRPERLREILAIPFEQYVYLGDYVAICSYEDATIEALIQGVRYTPSDIVERAFRGVEDDDDETTDDSSIIIDGGEYLPNSRLRVGLCSDEMLALTLGSAFRRQRRRPSLRIEGLPFTTHDVAVSLLERISNSLFFQIDTGRNIQLSLFRERRRRSAGRTIHRRRRDRSEVQFPRMEYDQAPITLYWYAGSAVGMPLLQFLAYYQCIEFYYPTYSQADARRRVRNVLKSPTFRADRDADIGRVLTALSAAGRGSVGDERSMLRATIRECVDPAELRTYLEEFEERRDFFSARAKGLTDCKLPIANIGADLRDDVADRIYDIRCRIVHTKTGVADGSVDLLLPFSKEEQMLVHDIDLIRFLAQQVLIAGSSTLQL